MERLLLQEMLEQAGFDVMAAEDGSTGVRCFTEKPPDIVLMDVEMPNMDGFSACAAIRRLTHGRDTPILMVTGHDDVESVHRAFEIGATDFLPKPINWALLGYRVRYLLRASRTYHALKASEARLAKAQHMARLGHWDWNVSENRWYFSDEVCRIFGFATGDRPADHDALAKVIDPDDLDHATQLFAAALRGEEKYEVEYRLIPADGTPRVVAEQVQVRLNKEGRPEYVEGTVQDVTKRRHAEDRIRYLAYYDDLTGLPNRQMFSKQVAHALRRVRRNKQPLAFLILDLDNFKSINDTEGHSVGDRLLEQVAGRLSQCVRGEDLISRPFTDAPRPDVFRFGGDEFALLISGLQHEQDASVVARRIVSSLSEPFKVGAYDVYATASIGIALYPTDGEDVGTLLRNADSAMYQAKQKGKNTFEFYTKSLTQICTERMNMEARLRRAIEQRELYLCYQPVLGTQSGCFAWAEALLRWNSSDLGHVPPAKFIGLAEETGLITPIGDWIFREACRQMQVWKEAGLPPIAVSVNVSARQFQHSELSKSISNILDETRLGPQYLRLELTESAIMADVPRAKLTLQKLSELGVRLSIDDFGTGYSSLSELRWLPLDALKIDQSFVRDLPKDKDAAAIALAIIAMAHSLGIAVVAEGVETEAQLAFLKEHHCDEVQGYLVSPPVPAPQLVQFLENAGLRTRRDKFQLSDGRASCGDI